MAKLLNISSAFFWYLITLLFATVISPGACNAVVDQKQAPLFSMDEENNQIFIDVSKPNNKTIVLDPSLLPSADNDRRLLIIGDVHGCMAALKSLLEELNYNIEKDHIILLGDFIKKGPNTKSVIDFAIKHDISCVRGNHENSYLKTLEETNFKENPLGLTHEQVRYLKTCAYGIDLGDIDDAHYVAVHAGMEPGKPLAEQDPWTLMHIRNIHRGKPLQDRSRGRGWTYYWNKYQKKSNGSTVVFYGHDASRGLKVQKFTIGLDSRCVRGGELSSYVLPDRRVVSIPCSSC